jgi:hypothetical protein
MTIGISSTSISDGSTTFPSNISTNTSNIATNVTNIATNTTNIATNTTNIATNTTNIGTNTTAIDDRVKISATSEQSITNTLNMRKLRINSGNESTGEGDSGVIVYDGWYMRFYVKGFTAFRVDPDQVVVEGGAPLLCSDIQLGGNMRVFNDTGDQDLVLRCGGSGAHAENFVRLRAYGVGSVEFTALSAGGDDERVIAHRDVAIDDAYGVRLTGTTAPATTTNKIYRTTAGLQYGSLDISGMDTRITTLETNTQDHYSRVSVTSTPHVISSGSTTYIFGCNHSGETLQITLPEISALSTTNKHRTILVVDESGLAGTNNIVINRAGSDTISGQTSYTLNTNYSSLEMYSNGSDKWFIK